MQFGQKPTIRDMAKVVDDRLGRTTGGSKGKAPVSAKPKIKASGTNPLKKQIGVKATWAL